MSDDLNASKIHEAQFEQFWRCWQLKHHGESTEMEEPVSARKALEDAGFLPRTSEEEA